MPSISDATFKYTWKIRKYAKLSSKKDSFDSLPFECNANGDKTRWNLSIRYWKGKEGKRLESPVVMCLNLLNSTVANPGQATVGFEFGVFNTKTGQWETCPRSRTVLNLPSSQDILSVGYRDLNIHKPHLEKGTGSLCIYVKIQLSFTDDDDSEGTSLQKDLARLMRDAPETGDVILQCAQGRQLHAHSHILAARSPVLRQMLLNGDTLDLGNLTDEVVQLLITYMYTDRIDDLVNNATVLLSNAHRFQLAGLKSACEKYLSDTISAANVPSLLLAADQFECDGLKQAVFGYCEDNASAIQKSMTWKVLEMVNPELFEEVCEAGLGSSVSSNIDSLPSDPESP